jgi:hypothetical protein
MGRINQQKKPVYEFATPNLFNLDNLFIPEAEGSGI